MKSLRLSAFIIYLFFFITPVSAQNYFVVPITGTNSEGSSMNLIPFSCSGLPSMRYQQAYSMFSLGAGTISMISFRLDQSNPSAFGPVILPNVLIEMSTMDFDPDGINLSTTYSDNIGSDVTTVYSDDLSLSAPECITTPCPFDVMIPLQTPFFYNPSAGNLLVDVRVPTCVGLGNPGNILFDATVLFDTSRLWTNPVTNLTGTVDSSYGLITQFEVTLPTPADINLSELIPGNPGSPSEITVTNAEPGSTVNFYYSFNTGFHELIGGICGGQTLSLESPNFIGSDIADGAGTASLNIPIPLGANGITVHMQAYAVGETECGISNLVTQTIGDQPPPLSLVLGSLDPGIAGGNSSLTVTGAPRGETIKFKYSLSTGSSSISGGVCNGENLDLKNQKNIGMAVASLSGEATLNVPIPSRGSGVTVHMQAYTETGPSCEFSNPVSQILD